MKVDLTIIFLFIFAFAVNSASGATLRGQLQRSDGKPLPYVEIELVPVESDKIVIDRRLNAVSSVSGKFSFIDVPDGRYTLSINFDDRPTDLSPFTTLFYPNTPTRSEAAVFEMNAQSKYPPVTFRAPPALPMRNVVGKAVFPDGKPAVGARIGLRDIIYDDSTGYTDKVDRNGNFSIKGFLGRLYQVGGVLYDEPLIADGELIMPLLAAGESEIFKLDANTPTITIQIRSTGNLKRIRDKFLGMNFFKDREAL